MADHDAFSQAIKNLLAAVPGTSLPQWQFAYKRVISTMGLKILEQFPDNVIGQDPGPSPAESSAPQPKSMAMNRGPSSPHMDGGTGGQSGGPVINIAIAALYQPSNPPT
jgi:hypothetical protein